MSERHVWLRPTPGSWRPSAAELPRLALFGLGYFALACLTLAQSSRPGMIALVWYANALAVTLLAHLPLRHWWAWLAMVVLANGAAQALLGSADVPIWAVVPANLVEIMVGAGALLHYRVHHEAAQDPVQLWWTLLLGSIGPGAIGATCGVLLLHQQPLQGGLPELWLAWFVGTVTGGVTLLPLALWLLQNGRAGLRQLLQAELVGYGMLLLALALLVPLWLPYPFIYLSLALVLLAMRRGFGSTAAGVVLVSLAVGWLIADGIFQPPPMTTHWQPLLFYLPLLLTLIPPLLLAAAVDERRTRLLQLRESEARYRSLYRRTPAMMHSLGSDGRILSVSDLWLRKLGYQEHEVLGRRSVDFLTPESRRHALEQVLPRFEREGRCDSVPYQWLTRDGRVLDGLLSALVERAPDGALLRTLAVIEDVTERNRLAAELAASELFEVTLHSIGDGVITTDAQGRIELLNPVAESLLGCSRTEARGRPFDQIVQLHEEGNDVPLADPVQSCLTQGRRSAPQTTVLLRARDGRQVAVQHSVAPIRGKDGQLLGAVMVFQDVSAARALAARMAHLAQHDALTDLPNRVLLQDRIRQCCQRGLRDESRFAVMMLDLDHFKRINDTLGHEAGDTLLRRIAGRLLHTLRASDTVCRLGGDEFVVLLAELPAGDDAADVAEKILHEVTRPIDLDGAPVSMSISLGIAIFPEDGSDPEALMRHADTAMYRAKREGRNGYCFFTQAMDDSATQRLTLEQDLRSALARHEFTLHFQPVVDVLQGRVVAAEALVRWQRPGGGLLSPGRFLPTAEETRLIRTLGRWILRAACEQYQLWCEEGQTLRHLSVNVSALELDDAQFLPQLSALLTELGIEPGVLELEISEATLMSEGIATLLQQLRELGVRIAVDDFGSGLSSLSLLKRLPVDTIKLAPLFVRELPKSPADREIVRAVLAVGSGLGVRVVVEGVEQVEQLRLLRSLGAVEMQGHLLARPAPATLWRRLVNAIVIPS